MRIVVNLLPDTRQKRQKHKQQKQLFTGIVISILIFCGVAVVIEVLVVTSLSITNGTLTAGNTGKIDQLKSNTQLIPALTLNDHAESLSTLYNERNYMTDFFAAYSKSNPQGVSLSSLALSNTSTLTVNGTATDYKSVSRLAQALEQYRVDGQEAFTSVTINSVGSSNGSVSFGVTALVAPSVTQKKDTN